MRRGACPLSRLALAGVLAVLGAAARAAVAEDGPPAAPAPSKPLSSLEAGVLPRSEVIVVGTARVIRPGIGGAPTLVRVEAETVLKGRAEPSFVLFVGGPHNTTDPQRPSEDYFRDAKSRRYALFLRATPNGSGLALETLFPADDEVGREKVAALEAELALTRVADPAERARRSVAFLLDLLASGKEWSQAHAANEMARLAAATPAAFTPDALAEIDGVRRRTFDERLRARLGRVLSTARGAAAGADATGAGPAEAQGSARPAAPSVAPAEAPSPEFLRARRRLSEPMSADARVLALTDLARLGKAQASPDLLAALRLAPEPAVRERAAVLLGDVGARETWPAVQAVFAGEQEPAVREAIVRAAGLLAGDDAVGWLVERAQEKALVRPAAFALARIRTPSALEALDAVGRAACAASPPDEATSRLVEYLKGPAFVEAERVAGRTVGPRAGSTPARDLRKDAGSPSPSVGEAPR